MRSGKLGLVRRARAAGLVVSVLLGAGCAVRSYAPTPVKDVGLTPRAISQTRGPVRVSTVVPDAHETETLFGLSLYERGIQPVWLEIENRGDSTIRLALVSLDPDYFSPLEVAYMHRKGFNDKSRAAMETWFHGHAMQRRISPGETRSGFVFTHLEPGTKAFNVDLYGNEDDYTFTFFVSVPGFVPDHAEVDFAQLYEPHEIEPLTPQGLRQALTTLACCSSNGTGEVGDPFNAVLVGNGLVVARALMRARWTESASGSEETLAADSHRYGDRSPDATFHKIRRGGSDRLQLRLWLSPMRVDDQPVWLGQVSHELRSGKRGPRIDPDLDAARGILLQDLWFSQSLARVGATTGGGPPAPIDRPRTSFSGAEYFTDGLRAILWLSERPVGRDEMVVLDWERVPFR